MYTDPTGNAVWVEIDGEQYFVGESKGEFNKELNAYWVVNNSYPGGGYWDFVGDKSPVSISPSPLLSLLRGPLPQLETPTRVAPSRLLQPVARGNLLLAALLTAYDLYENGVPCFMCQAQGLKPGDRIPGSALKDKLFPSAYIPPPRNLPAFPGAKRVRSKSQRARWVDEDGNIYEWDSQHGKVEKYNKRGKHLGEFDPNTGEQTKPADPSRSIEP